MSGAGDTPADAVAHIQGDAAQEPAWPLISTLPPLAPFVSVPQVARAHGWRMPVVTLRLLSDGVRLLAEVHDQAPGRPVLTGADGDAVSGRGLGIVDTLSARWGWHPVAGGKCCWALLRKEGQVSPPTPGESSKHRQRNKPAG